MIPVDVEPGESPMDRNIYNMSEKGLEWLTRVFELGREPCVPRLDLVLLVNRRQFILTTAMESERF